MKRSRQVRLLFCSGKTLPLQISRAIKISRKSLEIVYENVTLAIGVKRVCLVMVVFGLANLCGWLSLRMQELCS